MVVIIIKKRKLKRINSFSILLIFFWHLKVYRDKKKDNNAKIQEKHGLLIIMTRQYKSSMKNKHL